MTVLSRSSAMLPSISKLLICALLILDQTSAHTWIEQIALVGKSGKYVGAYGYPRGYIARTDPGFDGFSNNYLLPPLESGRTRVDASDLLCHPAQRAPTQNPLYPRLSVSPGRVVAMKYLENGHVTLPMNQLGKPPKGGTVFVFGTTSPRSDERIKDVLRWTRDGTGGDGRGRLLAANNFDDDRCHQINTSPISQTRQQTDPDPFPDQPTSRAEQWCETNVRMPADLAIGECLTVYWIWQWPTAPGKDPIYPDGKDEYYTTCSDFEIVAQQDEGPVKFALAQQDPQVAAVKDHMSRAAITPHPLPKKGSRKGKHRGHKSKMSQPAPSAPPSESSILGSSPVLSPTPTSTPAASTTPPSAPPTSSPLSGIRESSAVPLTPSYVPSDPSSPASVAPTSTTTSPPVDGTAIVVTALVTVVATLQPGQQALIVQGTHRVTFMNPQATIVPRALAFDERSPGLWRRMVRRSGRAA